MSMKISNDTICNRTSDLPICSTVPLPMCHHQRSPHSYVGKGKGKGKGKAIPLQAWEETEFSRRMNFPDFKAIDT
jgi:hypothetical protein